MPAPGTDAQGASCQEVDGQPARRRAGSCGASAAGWDFDSSIEARYAEQETTAGYFRQTMSTCDLAEMGMRVIEMCDASSVHPARMTKRGAPAALREAVQGPESDRDGPS